MQLLLSHLRPLPFKLFLLSIIGLFLAIFAQSNTVHASTYTVCSAACDFTTVTDAIAGAINGDTINVTESVSDGVDVGGIMMLSVNKEVTISCSPSVELQNVQQVRIFSSNVSFSGCTLTQVSCSNSDNPAIYTDVAVSSVNINNNTIENFGQGIVTGYFAANNGLNIYNNSLTNVCGPTGISLTGMGSISSNTIELTGNSIDSSGIVATGLSPVVGLASISVTGNTISSSVLTDAVQVRAINLAENSGEADVVVTGNTIYTNDPSQYISTGILFNGNAGSNLNGKSVTIQNNVIGYALTGIDLPGYTHENFTINNNTFYFENTPVGNERAMAIRGAAEAVDGLSFRNNIISGYPAGIIIEPDTTDTNIQNLTEDYNAYWGVTSGQEVSGTDATGTLTLGINSTVNTNPGFTDPLSGDYTLLAFSAMIDAGYDGSDLGGKSYSGARTTTIYVGTGRDFTGIQDALDHVVASGGDTISVAAGTYAPTSSLYATDKSFTLTGAGAGSTIIDASGLTYGFNLNNVDSAALSNFSITGDATTRVGVYLTNGSDGNTLSNITVTGVTDDTTAYLMSQHPFSLLGRAYAARLGPLLIYGTGGSDTLFVDTNDEDIVSALGSSPFTMNLALAVADGTTYYTVYMNDTFFGDSVTAEAHLDTLGAGDFVINCWVDDVFTYSAGAYTYTAPTGCTGRDPVVITTYQTGTPSIDVAPQTGGFIIDGSMSNTLTSVTVTGGANGVVFIGSAATNAVNTSTVDTNTFDIYSTSSGNNSISGTTYTTSRVTGEGVVSGINSAPTGTFNSAAEITDGTGFVSVSIEVDDPDDDDSKAKIEYETDSDGGCNGPWANISLRGTTATADFGAPSIEVGTYQIGTTTAITTSSGSNSVSFTWSSATNLPTADGSQCLRLTVNDATADQSTPATQLVAVDNVDPTGLSALTASAASTTSASLSWGAVTETNFDHYEVWYGTVQSDVENRTGTATEWDNSDDSNLATSTRALTTITGLRENTTYYFEVWAVDTYGNEGTVTVARAATSATATAGQGSPTILTTLSGSSTGSSSTRPSTTTTTEETRPAETTDTTTDATTEETRPTEVTQPTITEEERRQQAAALEAATGTVGTAIQNIVGGESNSDRKPKANINSNQIETAIKAYEERTALPTKEEDRIEDQRVKEDIILGSMLKNEEVSTQDEQKAQDIIEKNIEVSIDNAISKSKDTGGTGVLLNLGKKQVVEVTSTDTLKIVVKNLYSPEELETIRLEAEGEGKTLVAIDERSNIDSDPLSDLYQIGHNLPLFNDNPDEDDFLTWEELYLGTDPREPNEIGATPKSTNLDGAITGPKPSIRLSGMVGDEVDIVLIKKEEREKLAKAKSQMGYASVLLADTVNPSINQISLGKLSIDDKNKGELTPENNLEDGEYYLVLAGKSGIGEIASFTVDSLSVPPQPELITYEEQDGVIKGKAEPGEIIFVTWKSRIYSSIIISDASEGAFELELPEDLPSGDHEVLVYLYRENDSLLSSVTNLLFNR